MEREQREEGLSPYFLPIHSSNDAFHAAASFCPLPCSVASVLRAAALPCQLLLALDSFESRMVLSGAETCPEVSQPGQLGRRAHARLQGPPPGRLRVGPRGSGLPAAAACTTRSGTPRLHAAAACTTRSGTPRPAPHRCVQARQWRLDWLVRLLQAY
jgi:hypothetical protein